MKQSMLSQKRPFEELYSVCFVDKLIMDIVEDVMSDDPAGCLLDLRGTISLNLSLSLFRRDVDLSLIEQVSKEIVLCGSWQL